MPVGFHDSDYLTAQQILGNALPTMQLQLATAIAEEREACAKIALAIDSGRGNEKEIAKAIRSRSFSSDNCPENRPMSENNTSK